MNEGIIAIVNIKIKAPIAAVWDALINPKLIKEYMFGSTVTSNWKDGSPIVWKGEWRGKPFEDKGTILCMAHEKMLQYNHYSPLSGIEDKPENYNLVTIELFDETDGVLLSLTQDNNKTEAAKESSVKKWKLMLESMKNILEHSN